MSEPKPEYVTETEEALEMLGKGYEPAATIEGPRTVRELTDKGLETFKTWGWIKVSANFIAHIKKLKGAKLAIWQTIALSIDETGKCKLPLRQIEELTGYSHTEVIESIQELQEMGYLGVDKTKKTNIYTPEFAARGAGNDPSNGKETLVKKLESTPAYQNESSPSEENSTPSISRVKRVNTPKGDMVDFELSKLPAMSIRKAISEYFKLNTNWETKYNRQWMEWAVEAGITADQIQRAAETWRMDKQFNWQVPTLKGIFEKWQLLMDASPEKPKGKVAQEDIGDRDI